MCYFGETDEEGDLFDDEDISNNCKNDKDNDEDDDIFEGKMILKDDFELETVQVQGNNAPYPQKGQMRIIQKEKMKKQTDSNNIMPMNVPMATNNNQRGQTQNNGDTDHSNNINSTLQQITNNNNRQMNNCNEEECPEDGYKCNGNGTINDEDRRKPNYDNFDKPNKQSYQDYDQRQYHNNNNKGGSKFNNKLNYQHKQPFQIINNHMQLPQNMNTQYDPQRNNQHQQQNNMQNMNYIPQQVNPSQMVYLQQQQYMNQMMMQQHFMQHMAYVQQQHQLHQQPRQYYNQNNQGSYYNK